MTHDLSFPSLIPSYLDACTSEGKSPKTVIAYRESLNMYLRRAGAHDPGRARSLCERSPVRPLARRSALPIPLPCAPLADRDPRANEGNL